MIRKSSQTGVRRGPHSCSCSVYGRLFFALSSVSSELMAGKAAIDQTWAQAARSCRLSADEVHMARELGFTPRSLLNNLPTGAQPWKAPVALWVRDLYEKRQRRTEQRRRRRERALRLVAPEAEGPAAPAAAPPSGGA
jgi:hypothetical protein